MRAKTELFLYRMMWLAEGAIHPTFRNLTESFEGWAYRNGLLQQIDRLESCGLLEAVNDPRSGDRLHRLTEAGCRAASGGRDPEFEWSRKWDRKWRMFLFDIPERESSKRKNLTRSLAGAGCGCLQRSVWISPATPSAIEEIVAEEDPECAQLLLFCADSKGKCTDKHMVEAAWDFQAINGRYHVLTKVLDAFPGISDSRNRERFEEWSARESAACREALAIDPLLPAELLPEGYRGREVWRHRKTVMAEAARLAAQFGGGS